MAKFPFSVFFLLLLKLAATQAASFNCTSPAAECQALATYVPIANTTYAAIKELFQVDSILDLFGANGIPATAPPSTPALTGAAVLVPFPCACSNGRGISDHRPIYTVKQNNTLFIIATEIFGGLVEFMEIAQINNISNPDKIEPGQKFRIPLPCSCDQVAEFPVKHVTHRVEAESSLEKIATKYGTNESLLLKINGIVDPKSLKGDQILDVPIRVCNSSIRSDAVDGSLRVGDRMYAFTAGDCVQCSCSSSSWILDCKTANSSSKNSSVCVAPTCSEISLKLGESAPRGCGTIRCDYGGYYNTSALNITAVAVTDQTGCRSSAGKLLPLLGYYFAPLLLFFSL